MRLAALLAILSAAAAPARAGCFAEDGMPARAVYDDGSALDYLDREDEVLTYRSGGVVSRMQAGLWPLEHRGEGHLKRYEWDTPLPDLKAVIAAGGKARVEGRVTETGKAALPVAVGIEVIGTRTVDWEDCRYEAVEFRKTIYLEGRKLSEGVMLYAPAAMIAFRTESVEPATGTTHSYALEALE